MTRFGYYRSVTCVTAHTIFRNDGYFYQDDNMTI
jgi:hypothetical protein